MPSIESFNIKKFRGIENLTIKLPSSGARGGVVTLLGLNECGKTTVLEAISNFLTRDAEMQKIFLKPGKIIPEEMIPLKDISNFNRSISIQASVRLDASDIQDIILVGKDSGVDIVSEIIPETFTITQSYVFKDSVLESTNNIWNVNFSKKGKVGRKISNVRIAPLEEGASGPDVWRLIVFRLRENSHGLPSFRPFLSIFQREFI
jgi:predicted ATP-dependent endonuclease of OLD family